jgi:MmyB-like transcription regulator ligand binding domain
VAAETVAALRLDAGRHPEDPQLTDLVEELSIKTPEFRTWWADHDVRERTHDSWRYRHPMVGDLTLEYEVVTFAGDPDQAMCVYTVEPASPSEAALQFLASWQVPPRPMAGCRWRRGSDRLSRTRSARAPGPQHPLSHVP